MKKVRDFATIWVVLIILALLLAGAGAAYYFTQYKPAKDREDLETVPTADVQTSPGNVALWQTYTNDKYKYTVRYPKSWYKWTQGYAPPEPETIMFGTKPDGQAVLPYASVQIFTQQRTDITDIAKHPEVTNLVGKGEKLEMTTIDGFEAAKVSGQDTMAIHASYYLIGNENVVYRIGYQYPLDEPNYAADCEGIVKSFKVTETNP